MRRRICGAVVTSLDQHGYAETTINRVQAAAGVSRGALTHHFPTKQALMAATAMQLLANAMAPLQTAPPVADLLLDSWTRIANTPEGRAFVEILIACRTDRDLYDTLAGDLAKWDAGNATAIQSLYTGSDAAPDDAALLWSITRSFIRGLIAHERFVSDPAYLERMVRRFAAIMQDHLIPKDAP